LGARVVLGVGIAPGEAVQVEPMKFKLKAPGTKRLKLRYDHLLSMFAFNSNLRRYNLVEVFPRNKRRWQGGE
jgi:hypothetical protein